MFPGAGFGNQMQVGIYSRHTGTQGADEADRET